MIKNFENASGLYQDSDLYSGLKPPFESFRIPEFLNNFCDELLNRESNVRHSVKQILLFGGGITDQRLGLKPKDYDLYICNPSLADTVDRILQEERRSGLFEAIEDAIGYDFPIIVHEESFSFNREQSALGTCFGVQGMYQKDGQYHRMDLTIGSQFTTPREFSRYPSAPILSAVVSLRPGDREYAYHRDFEAHAAARVLCTDEPNRKYFEKKAERKNLQIMTSAQWDARQTEPSILNAGSVPALQA